MFGGADRREIARYLTLSQVGVEMVAPIVVGVLIDRYLASSPWGAAVGAVLGLTIGLVHLVKLGNKEEPPAGNGKTPEPPS